MNNYQKNLYRELMSLVEESESFYYADFENEGYHFRIFNYRLCSYTEFCKPSALECRGVSFEINRPGLNAAPIRLASLPFEKFFNLHECPFTMDLDLSTVTQVDVKADGSLISTYVIEGNLYLKSKGSLSSDQALAAMEWINDPARAQFKRELIGAERLGYTVNMEWCAPDNRIVLGYMEPQLYVLGVRSREDGTYVDFYNIDTYNFSKLAEHWTGVMTLDHDEWNGVPLKYTNWIDFINDIPNMIDTEGFVVHLNSGQRVKIKTEWYLVQHRAKDSINSPRRLYEAVLAEATDDLRTLFCDDPLVILKIEEMELFVEKIYNHLVDTVERFYERNKEMERKEYAILGQEELTRHEFGLAMSKYVGKPVDYKDYLARKWKEFGVTDDL